MDPEVIEPTEGEVKPDLSPARKALVTAWCDKVKADKKHWKPAFDRMREDQNFAYGAHWSKKVNDPEEDRYVANITLRHVQQRVAALYAKNPKTVARTKERLMTTVWDGTASGVMQALQPIMTLGAIPGGNAHPEFAKNMAILQEAQAVTEERKQMEQFAKTLQYLYEYNIDEQAHPFKAMMKLVVRRAVTTAVGYVKLGFQRVMEPRPDLEAQISDATQQLATLERLAKSVAKDDTHQDDPEMERLRLLVQTLQNKQDLVVREGLVFDYPGSLSIIPDKCCKQLREFLGCDHVAEEFVMTPERVEEIYGIDLKDKYAKYFVGKDGSLQNTSTDDGEPVETDGDASSCVVWEIYSRTDGLVYVVCDGYEDFLREPAPPETYTERFWPWYPLVLNECDHPEEIFPPSDVRLLRHQQREYNRLREGLREHRKQNRPLTISASGVLSDDDKDVLRTRPAAALVELDALSPGQKVQDVIQPFQFAGVDPNLYEVNGVFEDVLRTVGVQEANLGGASGNTATETSIAESSRMSALQSNIDDIDDMLSLLARASGQILLANVGPEQVKKIVGPAAVWPTLTRQEMAEEIYLEVEAGSTGRPNQAQEIQNFERLAPLLMQIPGMKPEKLAAEGIRRLDDKLKLEDLYDENLPSIAALNQMMGQAAGGPQQNAGPNAPAEQGAQGSGNAPAPSRPAGNPAGVNEGPPQTPM